MAVPGAWKVDGEKVVTYLEAILQEKLPKSVIVIGSGAIGVEFSTVWSSYGVDVTIVEMLPRLVPLEDEEVSKELKKEFEKRGIKCLVGNKVESVEATENGVQGQGLRRREGNNSRSGAGPGGDRVPSQLERLRPGRGRRQDQRARLCRDQREDADQRAEHLGHRRCDRQADAGARRLGDGHCRAENIAGAETVTLDYEMMPRATYCHPQVASFGLTEAQAKERGYNVKIGRFPFQANGKALGLGDYAGWVKIVVDEKYGEILGAHMIGPEVTELLPELTLAHMMELTPHEIARNVHAHPTLSEVLMEAAHAAEGTPIHM